MYGKSLSSKGLPEYTWFGSSSALFVSLGETLDAQSKLTNVTSQQKALGVAILWII